jgi:hypothetical protein
MCGACGLTTNEGSHGSMIEIVEMYDENYVDISNKSPVYRAAKKRYDADGKWHFLCSNCYRADDDDLYDVTNIM